MTEAPEKTDPSNSGPIQIECESCQRPLLLEGESILVRCSACGKISERDANRSKATDRMAWRSLWLGLASVFFLFLTGLPAIYYGVRSLLRMRYTAAEKGDRVAAVGGITSGLFFGLVIGPCFAFFAIIIAAIALTRVETEVPAEIISLQDRLIEIEIPKSFQPEEGVSMLNSQHIIIWVKRANDHRQAFLQLGVHENAQSSQLFSMSNIIKSRVLYGRDPHKELESESLVWNICGKEMKVIKTKMTQDHEGETIPITRYHCAFFLNGQCVGIALVHRDSDEEFSDEMAKTMFESLWQKHVKRE